MDVRTTEGALVITDEAEKFKGLEGDELQKAVDADVAQRNEAAEKLGIKTRYVAG